MERNQERLWFLAWAIRCESSLRLETRERRNRFVGRGRGIVGERSFQFGTPFDTQERGLYRVCTPLDRNLGSHLRILPAAFILR